MSPKTMSCLFLLLAHVSLTGGLAAQAVKKDAVIEKEYGLEEVTVWSTASRRSIESTAPVRLLSHSQLEAKGITGLADALRRFSGVNVKDYGGAGGMKTVSVRSLGSQHTAVTYDGIAVTDCQSGQIDLSRFSLDNVQSLSLTVGDNDEIFQPARTFASAASVHLQTKAPDFSEKGHRVKAEIKAGSFGLFNPFLRYDQRLGEHVSTSLTGDFQRADNLYPFTLVNGKYVTHERRNNNYIETWRGEWNLRARLGNRSTLDGKAYYYDSFRQLPGAVIYYNDRSRQELSDRNFFAQAHYRTYWNNNWSLQVSGKFNWAYSHYHDKGNEYPGGELNNVYYQREYYGSAAVLYTPWRAWAFAYAADYSFNNLSSNATAGITPYRHTLLQALSARYRTPRLTVTALLLGSIYQNGSKEGKSAGDAQRLSPSLSLAWKPFSGQEMYLRASYKDIFRVATFTENYFDRWGSRDLKPEVARQFNVGLTYGRNSASFLKEVHLTADAYYNYVKDKIVAMPYNMFFWTMVNLGRVDILGADLSLEASIRPAEGHRLLPSLSYTCQYAVDKTDPNSAYYNDQIPYTPRHSGAASLAWENPWANLAFHATGVGKRYSTVQNIQANELEGYVECGLSVYRPFRWKGAECLVRGDILNLADKQYCIVKNYPMPGRSYQITLNITL